MKTNDYGWREAGQTVGGIVLTYGTLWLIYRYHTFLPGWVGALALAAFVLPLLAFGALIVLSGAMVVARTAGGRNLP